MSYKEIMAVEAIAHQGRSPLFVEINAMVKKVQGLPKSAIKPSSLETLGFGACVMRYTGINTSIKINDELAPNAWVYPPYIDANQALLDDIRRESYWSLDHVATENAKAFGQHASLTGTVDRQKSRVTGDFTKISCPMEVTMGLLMHEKASSEMVTAAILHEIGHVFTYFEFYGRMTTFNGALQAAVEQFTRADTREDKIKIIRDIDGKFGTETADIESLATVKDPGVFVTTYARTYMMDRKSSLGSTVYDITLWESLADQFAMRHGSGLDAVKLDELFNKSVLNSSYQSWMTHILLTLLKSTLWVVVMISPVLTGTFPFGLMIPLVLMLFVDPTTRIYDEPRARIDRMIRDMMAGLKSPHLTKFEKDALVDDIDAAKVIAAQFSDKAGLIEFFYASILPSGRRETSQRKFQLDMEKLTTNELLVAGGRLGQLIKKA